VRGRRATAAIAAPAFGFSGPFNPEAPAFTPLAGVQMRADAAEFYPMWGGCPGLQRAVDARTQKQRRQMPPATDEEWETRIQKREKEVVTIKSLQSYRLYVEVFPHDKRSDGDPKTPDPHDRTVSKRMWKWNVEKWRLQLKSRCVYSRAVALQCREYLLRQERSGEAGEERNSLLAAPGRDGPEEALGRELLAVPGVLRTEPIDRLPALADIPEPPGIAMPAGAGAGAGKFQ